MVRVEMLTVGKELLIGRTLNTNAYWAGARLSKMGTTLQRVTTIDDDVEEIASTLKEILRRAPDFLIVVGGLGPTPDDMTLRGIAKGLGVGMKSSRAALTLIREHYAGRGLRGIELTAPRKKMAALPAGAAPMVNVVGTAPGVRVVYGPTTIFSLPGVPAEMRSIFRRSVEPEVRGRLGKIHRKYVTVRLEGIFESELAPIIAAEMRRHPGVYIKSHPGGVREGVSRIQLDISALGADSRRTDDEAFAVVEETKQGAVAAGATVKSSRDLGRRSGA